MIAFFAGRAVYGAAVLLAVASLVFGLIHLSGDPLDALVPPGSSPTQEAVIRHRFALDRPLAVQYATFLSRAVGGDFGESWGQRRPALPAVLERLPATLALTGAAVGLALLVGVSLGIAAGVRPHGPVNAAATGLALLGQAIPGFALGTILILIFAVHWRWFPPSGGTSGEGWRALVLPAVTLAAYPAATIARLLRASLIETLVQDYIRTARGKGLQAGTTIRRHALRNAALPTLAFVGVQIGFLLGGTVVVEAVFAYPGAGQLALDAVAHRDLPLIQAFVVVLAALIVTINLFIDTLARYLDPRIGGRR